MSDPVYIGLFEKSGNMAKPFAEAGWECHCFDLDAEQGYRDGVQFHQADLRSHAFGRWIIDLEPSFIAAFPPCDHLAVSGARWFQGKGLRKLAESIELFAAAAEICEAAGCPYFIENPVSTISTYWRKPDHTFHPHQYAGFCPEDAYTKKTCLWAGGGFVMPAPCPLDGVEPDDRIHKAAPGPGRKDFRSATPRGFARAVFNTNAMERSA